MCGLVKVTLVAKEIRQQEEFYLLVASKESVLLVGGICLVNIKQ